MKGGSLFITSYNNDQLLILIFLSLLASLESKIPLDSIEERRKWRDDRLGKLIKHKNDAAEKN